MTQQRPDPEPEQVDSFDNLFPLTKQALDVLERDLVSDELGNRMVDDTCFSSVNLFTVTYFQSKYLSVVGGVNVADIVKRLMYKIFTNEVGSLFSWDGAKRKEKFKHLKIYSVILSK